MMQQSAVLNMVWLWMFGQGKSYKSYMVGGQRVESGMKRAQFNKIARSALGPIIEKLSIKHDWDFIYDEGSTTTASGTSEYTLEGNAGDCRDIINIRHGSGRGIVLEQLDYLQTDRREGYDSGSTTSDDSGTVYGYTLHGRSDGGFPKIQLFDTPSEAKTLTYRYRRNGLSVDDFPSEFGFVLKDHLIAQFEPKYLGVAEESLRELIADYKKGGDEIESVRVHPTIEAGNARRIGNAGGC